MRPSTRPSPAPPGYRLRNRLHVAGGRIGFYAPKSHEVSDLASCEIVSPALLARLPALRAALEPESRLEGELVTLESRAGDELVVELRPSAPYRDAPALVERLRAVTSGVRLLGPDGRPIEERGATSLVLDAGGARFRVSVSSFFQGNRHLLDAFLEEIRAGIAQSGVGARARSLDLYAGVGFLTRPLLEARTEATAVEIDSSAAADLEANLAAWSAEGLPRARAVRASAEAFAPRALRERSFALVVADPPRAGISKDVRRALLASPPPALLLVSCDPATFARDLGELKSVYDVRRLTLLDLFPSTHHVETVALLVSRS
jgi:tRNA/tmRNA/rRNA uracil-C5-methylase (TrmA/RlmC/RlmD family)